MMKPRFSKADALALRHLRPPRRLPALARWWFHRMKRTGWIRWVPWSLVPTVMWFWNAYYGVCFGRLLSARWPRTGAPFSYADFNATLLAIHHEAGREFVRAGKHDARLPP